MDETPPERTTPTPAEVGALQALVELRDRLLVLNAELEYLRLMLKLRGPDPGA